MSRYRRNRIGQTYFFTVVTDRRQPILTTDLGRQALRKSFIEVRHECDLKRCVDYIHVNPLQHGLVQRVRDWPWSSFHRYVSMGEYPIDWGIAAEWYGDELRYFE
jgi:REP element-mobilizing transposase RayT